MNVSPITVLAPNGNAPAPRESAPSGDLFGDLLRAPARGAAHEPAAPPVHTEKQPVPEPKTADRAERPAPPGREGDVRSSGDGAAREANAGGGDDSAPRGDTGETAAQDDGPTDSNPNGDSDADVGEEAAQASVNAAASEVAAAVLALINGTETRAPAEVGALAASTAVTAAGAPATPAVAVKPAVAATAPGVAAEEAPAEAAPPQDPGKKELGPVQITVTDERTGLVSRPAATLAAANVQAVAEAPAAPQAQAADSNAKPALNAAIAPDERLATEGQPGKDGGGKTTPVHDPALNFAAGAAKTAEAAAAAAPIAEKPAPQIQTQTSTPAPAPNPAAAAPIFAAVSGLVAATAPNVVMAPSPAASSVAANVAIDHVALQIGKAAADGLDRIMIQLKPEAMGRIDVQLQVHSDGRVHAVIAADRQDTLDLLQRDARSLERALNDAGLRADAGSLSFNLNGRGQNNGTGSPDAAPPSYAGKPDAGEPQPVPAALLAAYSAAAARGGVDIRV